MSRIEQRSAADEALARAFAERPPRSNHDEIDAEALWSAVHGDAEPAAVARLAERMADDSALAEDWRLAAAFAEEAFAEQDSARTKSPLQGVERGPRPAAIVRLVPVVALLAAAVLLVLAWPRGGIEPYSDDAGTLRGAEAGISAIRGDGDVTRADPTLEWTEVTDAVRYELFVRTPQLEVVVESLALEEPRYSIAAETVVSIPHDARLLWRVEAVRSDGRRIVSETFIATIR
ncbi:MAG: hypothetical protein AAF799_24840 [Myxococcota bacterium]